LIRGAHSTFGDKLISEEVKDLHEDWMTHADQVLADRDLDGGLRSVGQTPQLKPHTRPAGLCGGRSPALAHPEARSQLKLCRAGTRSAR
jgi:hypothetical protein